MALPLSRSFHALGVGIFPLIAGCLLTHSFDQLVGPDDAGASASSDALLEGGVAPPRYCKTPPLHDFCLDFDDGMVVNPMLSDGLQLSNGGTVTLDTTDFRSAPASLSSIVPMTTGTSPREAGHVSQTYMPKKQPTKSIRFAFDIRIVACEDATLWSAYLFEVNYIIAITVAPGGVFNFIEATSPSAQTFHPLTKPLPIGQWVRVTIDRGYNPRGYSVRIDGAIVTSGAPLPSADLSLPFQLNLGLAARGSARCEVHYDNVTYDVDPGQ